MDGDKVSGGPGLAGQAGSWAGKPNKRSSRRKQPQGGKAGKAGKPTEPSRTCFVFVPKKKRAKICFNATLFLCFSL